MLLCFSDLREEFVVRLVQAHNAPVNVLGLTWNNETVSIDGMYIGHEDMIVFEVQVKMLNCEFSNEWVLYQKVFGCFQSN